MSVTHVTLVTHGVLAVICIETHVTHVTFVQNIGSTPIKCIKIF